MFPPTHLTTMHFGQVCCSFQLNCTINVSRNFSNLTALFSDKEQFRFTYFCGHNIISFSPLVSVDSDLHIVLFPAGSTILIKYHLLVPMCTSLNLDITLVAPLYLTRLWRFCPFPHSILCAHLPTLVRLPWILEAWFYPVAEMEEWSCSKYCLLIKS